MSSFTVGVREHKTYGGVVIRAWTAAVEADSAADAAKAAAEDGVLVLTHDSGKPVAAPEDQPKKKAPRKRKTTKKG